MMFMVLIHSLMWNTSEFCESFQVWLQETLCKAYSALKKVKNWRKSGKSVILSFHEKTLLLRNQTRKRVFLWLFSSKLFVVDDKAEKIDVKKHFWCSNTHEKWQFSLFIWFSESEWAWYFLKLNNFNLRDLYLTNFKIKYAFLIA